jgi:hypothetical protein
MSGGSNADSVQSCLEPITIVEEGGYTLPGGGKEPKGWVVLRVMTWMLLDDHL